MKLRVESARRHRCRLLTLVVLWGVLGAVAGLAASTDSGGYLGRPLHEALVDLRARGLDVSFTSFVVRPEMRVVREPTATTLDGILAQLIAPHGLSAQTLPSGARLLVAIEGASSSIVGRVTQRDGGGPLAGVEIRIVGARATAITDPDGRFTLGDVSLGRHALEARRPGFVVGRWNDVEVYAGVPTEVVIELIPAEVPLDEIIVTPSVVSVLGDDPIAPLALDREDITHLPHYGDDPFRALTLLAGLSGSELTAQFHVRGGRGDEVLVLLDQNELIEPYHLRDFSNALSIVAPRAISEMQLLPGAFSAQFGDRMGGVLDIRTRSPSAGPRVYLGLSVLNAQASGAGSLLDGRGEWLALGRFGSLALASGFLSADELPEYWDGFAKLSYALGPRHRVGLRALHAGDRLAFTIREDGDIEDARTAYDSNYLWFSHQGLLRDDLFVDTVLSSGSLQQDRRASEIVEDDDQFFDLRDRRDLLVTGVKQDWGFAVDDRAYLRWGFDLRRLDIDYDYRNERVLEDPLAEIRSEPRTGSTQFRRRLRGDHYSFYVSDRMRLAKSVTAEIGLRYDEPELTGDHDVSPRINLALDLGKATTLRFSWGHFFQSQRLYELQVEDGETELSSSELTEHVVAGIERTLAGGAAIRLDLYNRDIQNPRLRYENIFEPITSFGEIEPDRVRIVPDRSRSRGIELFVRGRDGRRVDWWANYTYSRTEDEIEGRDVRRGIDQPHAFNADLSLHLGQAWTLNFAFRYHTGWPTTAVSGRLEEDDEGELELVPVFGPRNGERLADYHRLDLRASREWQRRKGTLSLFFDLQNLYNRRNRAGFNVDFDLEARPDGRVQVIGVDEVWGGFLPSFGIGWEF